MSNIANQPYLRDRQYKDATNFNARVELHKRFSTNPHGWLRYVFDQLLALPQACRILELGCGPAYLWADNQERIPHQWTITLSDFSPGMLREARTTLRHAAHPFSFDVIDAQAIPFADASFDAVIANHMLYHVPDRQRAYAEITRVLRPGGRLFAGTNGIAHLRELHAITERLDARATSWGAPAERTFLLENGGAELAHWFEQVEIRRYWDGLIVPEAEPLAAFILSMADSVALSDDARERLVHAIEDQIADNGPIQITKDVGLFIATRPRKTRP